MSNVDLHRIEVILVGDFNLDILDKNSHSTKEIINTLKQLGLRQIIKEPTRYSHNKDSCLDPFFIFFTNSDIIDKTGVCNVNISDHQMNLLTRKKAKFLKLKCNFNGRSYRNYNRDLFQDRIRNAN